MRVNMSTTFTALALLIMLTPGTIQASTEDLKGSKDHPLLKRFEGAVIVRYDHKEFDEYTVPLGKADKNDKLSQSTVVEGAVTRLLYRIPKGHSTLEVMRNYENELKGAGYKILFTGAKGELGSIARAAGWETPTYAVDSQRAMTAKLNRPQGDVHVVLFAVESYHDDSGLGIEKGQTLLLAHVIVGKKMENKLSKVDAEEMASAISDTGRVALYGIYFDTNKDDVKPESEPTLDEMAKFLKKQPALKVLVVGHTDNVGAFASNLDLSQRRAQAVVNMLVSKHGVGKERLTPVGDSFSAPVASNKTEEGRAKNRRVELVEQ